MNDEVTLSSQDSVIEPPGAGGTFDVQFLSTDELETLRKRCVEEIKRLQSTCRVDVKRQIMKLAAQHSLTVEDILQELGTKPAKAPIPSKYCDPETGKQWSGRGRSPVWFAMYEKHHGKDAAIAHFSLQ